MKKFISGLLIGLLISTSVFAIKADILLNSIKVKVNGKDVAAENIMYNSRTYVPLRAIGEILGKNVIWDEKTSTANINDKDYNPNASKVGYSKDKPGDLNTILKSDFQGDYDAKTLERKKYSANVTVKEIIRGDLAFQKTKEAHTYTSNPKSGFDYLLAKIEFEMLDAPDQYDLYGQKFKLVSEQGKEYESIYISAPEPSLDTKLYKGAKQEGYAVFQVEITDSKPLLTFGRDYYGSGGIWFKAYN